MPAPISVDTRARILELHDAGTPKAEVARRLGVSPATVYRVV